MADTHSTAGQLLHTRNFSQEKPRRQGATTKIHLLSWVQIVDRRRANERSYTTIHTNIVSMELLNVHHGRMYPGEDTFLLIVGVPYYTNKSSAEPPLVRSEYLKRIYLFPRQPAMRYAVISYELAHLVATPLSGRVDTTRELMWVPDRP